MPPSNVTLYAVWTVNSYTVSYDTNGGSGDTPAASTSHNYGTTVTVLGNIGTTPLTNSGYTFAGWNTLADGSGTDYAVGSSYTIPDSNTILYAKWAINTYNITYDGNGNTSGISPTDQTGTYTSSIELQTNSGSLTNTGYTFEGWNTLADGSGTDYAAGANYTIPASDTTLYAKWTANTYNITYDSNGNEGGTVPSGQSGAYNSSITLQNNTGILTITGYTFVGWNTAADGSGTDYAVGSSYTIPAGDTTLYAKWTINTYNVTYDGNGNTNGTTPSSQSSVYNSSVILHNNSGNLVKTGYTFAGWNTAADGSGTDYETEASYTVPDGDTTLYAKWVINEYNVTYDGNGNTAGAVPAAVTLYNYNSTVTVLGNTESLVKTGHTFAGWNTAADGSGTDYADGVSYTIPDK